jgi:hypothetical protein
VFASKKPFTKMQCLSDEQHDVFIRSMEWMSKAEAFDGAVYLQVIALSKSLVFRTHKFFTDQEDVDDFSEKHSPGVLIMDNLRIPPERRAAFWNQYKMAMLEGVNSQRQNAQTAIGGKLKGMMC